MLLPITSLAILATIFAAAPQAASQQTCAICPSASLSGGKLVFALGGFPGIPKFCGFASNSTTVPSGVEVTCFYNNESGNVFVPADSQCPQVATNGSCSFPF